MKSLLCLILFMVPCMASGPKYVGSKTDPQVYQEFQNAYHDISNPTINVGSASTMTITGATISTATITTATISTATITNLRGITNGSSPCSGCIGQVIHSEVTTQVNLPASTNYGDLTSIPLTAGNWLIWAQIRVNTASSTAMSNPAMGIGTASGNSSAGLTDGATSMTVNLFTALGQTNVLVPISVGPVSVSITTSATYYLKMEAVYTNGQPLAVGAITALRVS